MNKLEDLTILVTSCDKYYEAWDLFFTIFKKQGNELAKCPIILNTETKSYTFEDLNIITTSSVLDTSGWDWGRRVKFALSLVKTDYVLFVMEDMYLQRPVNIEVIKNCIKWLGENKEIACFNLEPLQGVNDESDKYHGFSIVKPGIKYRVNAQACVWRKSALEDSILPEESPWDWEIFGNMRNDYVFRDKQIYVLSWDEQEPFFTDLYLKKKDCLGRYKTHNGIMKGKWDVKLVQPLCKEYCVDINFDNLGVYREDKITLKERIKTTFPFSFMYKMYKRIRRKKYDEIEMQNELNLKSSEKYQKLVAPYITEDK